ncbi:hypothetical protein MOP88_14340 [Sphingomonas sp. WKB10]|nr:hypothetical protein [Sphingomonas sp. WKB10]
MSGAFTIRQSVQTVMLRAGVLQTVKMPQPIQTLTIKTAGIPGPRGEQGIPGPQGPAVTFDDLPDFTLIFDNQLV